MMAAKRKANGSYIQTEEQKLKKSISCTETFASRDCFSPEVRKKFSQTMLNNWAEGKIDTTNHWTKTAEGKEQLSEMHTGRKHSDTSRRNMSLGQQKRSRSKRDTVYTSAIGGTRSDLGMYFRSNWEANFARIMTFQGKTWEYEPKSFQLSNSMSYTPDFLVDGTYYELKGRMTETCKQKIDLFREQNPHVTLIVIDGVAYNSLRLQFKQLIPTWEGK